MPDDQALRIAAFREVHRLADLNGDLTSRDLLAGFRFEGTRIPLINPRRGIYKPTQMRYLLSIKTVFPRPGLREPVLLDAAHIIEDQDEQLGQPVVQNGIPLAKTHHAAFDAQLVGIDPDFKIHISDRILRQKDGPTLEALKRLDQNRILLPPRGVDRPDRDRLAQRFELFKARN